MPKTMLQAAALVVSLAALVSPAYAHVASAHVHAVTPLGECSVDNAEHSGGRIIPQTPAGAENAGPIVPGPIPLNTGNAAFDPESGGGNRGHPQCT